MATVWLVLVVVLVVAALVFGVVSLLSGDDPGLAPAEPDGHGARTLPNNRSLSETDLKSVTFDVALRGYRMDQVDLALRRTAYDVGYKDEMIAVLEAEVASLREGRWEDAELLRKARESAASTTVTPRDTAPPGARAAGREPITAGSAAIEPAGDASSPRAGGSAAVGDLGVDPGAGTVTPEPPAWEIREVRLPEAEIDAADSGGVEIRDVEVRDVEVPAPDPGREPEPQGAEPDVTAAEAAPSVTAAEAVSTVTAAEAAPQTALTSSDAADTVSSPDAADAAPAANPSGPAPAKATRAGARAGARTPGERTTRSRTTGESAGKSARSSDRRPRG
jgi:DivIVA domain-containing protein